MSSVRQEPPSKDHCAQLQVAIPRWAGAPKVARAHIREWCEGCAMPESKCETVVLLLSEAVTNAVMHADAPREAPVQVTAHLDDAVHVAVTDAGSAFPRRAA